MIKLIRVPKLRTRTYGMLFAAASIVIGYMLMFPSYGTGDIAHGEWIKIDPQDIELELGLVGRIESASRQVMTAPFDGVVEKINFSEGVVVNAGDLLVTLGTTQIDMQIRQALSELIRARQSMQKIQGWADGDEVMRARRSVAMAELNNQNTVSKLSESRQLYERGIVARMEVDALEQQLKLQSGELAAAKSDLRSTLARGAGAERKVVEVDLANAQAKYDDLLGQRNGRELRSTVNGIALRPPKSDTPGQSQSIQLGQKVMAGSALVEVASLSHVRAVARVEESDLHTLHEGMDVRVTGDGFSGISLSGRILLIGAQAIPSGAIGAAGNYDVIVDISPLSQEQQKVVRLGMSARLNVVTYSAKNHIVVPASAIRSDGLGGHVVSYRPSLSEPSRDVSIAIGRSLPKGVEVIGLGQGYVMSLEGP